MFRWCAYCVRFLGERAPYDDFSPTHGICGACVANHAIVDAAAIARVKPIFDFHDRLMATAARMPTSDTLPAANDLVAAGSSLGIRPADLMMGVLQPILYEVGRLWAEGKVTPAMEARFTRFVNEMLDALVLDQQRRLRFTPAEGRPIFLLTAAGNRHTVGIRMLGFTLREEGRDARVVTAPIEASWVAHLAGLLRPSLIGITVALPEQIGFAIEVAERIERDGLDARVIMGGFGARAGDRVDLPARLEVHDWTSRPDGSLVDSR